MKYTRLLSLLASMLIFLLVGCSLPSNRPADFIPVTGPLALQGTPNSLTSSPPAFLSDDNTPVPPQQEATQPAVTEPAVTQPAATQSVATQPAVDEPTALPSFTPSMLPTEALPTATLSPTPSATPTPTATPLSFFTPTVQITVESHAATPAAERSSLLGREQLFTELAASQLRNLNQGVIGEMRGMVYDSMNGQPLYAVAVPARGTQNRLIGARRALVPVPWGALNLASFGIYQPQAGVLLLPVEDHVLSTAPSFDQRMWDGKQPPHDWDLGIHDYWANFVPMAPGFGRISSGQAVSGAPFWLDKTQLRRRGIDVTGSRGETIGRLKDLVLDANGVVRYAVVLVDDILGLGGRLAPVPWNSLVWSPGGWFILQGSPAVLQSAPGYATRAAFPDLSLPGWDREIRGYWEK